MGATETKAIKTESIEEAIQFLRDASDDAFGMSLLAITGGGVADKADAELSALRAVAERVVKLAPPGSEFHDNLEGCMQWVEGKVATAGEIAAERNALRIRNVEITRTLEEALEQFKDPNRGPSSTKPMQERIIAVLQKAEKPSGDGNQNQ